VDSISRTGRVEVSVPSTVDVLQFIRLNLSMTTGTNLVSIETYKNVAASPNPGDRTRMYVNTTDSGQDITYTITDTGATPTIWMSFSTTNTLGGEDIAAGGTNTFDFTVRINSTSSLPGAVMYPFTISRPQMDLLQHRTQMVMVWMRGYTGQEN